MCSMLTDVRQFSFSTGIEAFECYTTCTTPTCSRIFTLAQMRRPFQFPQRLQHVHMCSTIHVCLLGATCTMPAKSAARKHILGLCSSQKEARRSTATRLATRQYVFELSKLANGGSLFNSHEIRNTSTCLRHVRLFQVRQCAQLTHNLQHVYVFGLSRLPH